MFHLKQGFVLVCFVLLNCSFVSAAEDPPQPIEFQLGPQLSSLKYKDPRIKREKGSLSGVVGRLSSHTGFAATLFEASYMSGEMDYKGEGVIVGIPNVVFELRAMLGRDFYLGDVYRMTPFIGLGYRNWNADASGKVSTTNYAGYEREQVYFYNPIGVELKTLPNGFMWVVSGRIEYDGLIKGVNHSYRSDASDNSDIKLTQNDGHGIRVAVSFEKPLTEQGSGIIIEPFFTHWTIAQSNVVTNAQGDWTEPANKSDEWGIALMMSF